MSRKLIIRNLATQDLRLQANYIPSNGNVATAEHFLELAEATFAQILIAPRIGKRVFEKSTLLPVNPRDPP